MVRIPGKGGRRRNGEWKNIQDEEIVKFSKISIKV